MLRKTPPGYRLRQLGPALVGVYRASTWVCDAPTRAEALALARTHFAAHNPQVFVPDVSLRFWGPGLTGRRPSGRGRWVFAAGPEAAAPRYAFRGLYAEARNRARDHARRQGWAYLYLLEHHV